MNQHEITRHAARSLGTYCAMTVLLSLAALICLAVNAQGFAALLLCVIVTIPGLVLSKFLEVRNMWQGKMGNAKAENAAALPGILSMVAAFGLVAWLVVFPIS